MRYYVNLPFSSEVSLLCKPQIQSWWKGRKSQVKRLKAKPKGFPPCRETEHQQQNRNLSATCEKPSVPVCRAAFSLVMLLGRASLSGDKNPISLLIWVHWIPPGRPQQQPEGSRSQSLALLQEALQELQADRALKANPILHKPPCAPPFSGSPASKSDWGTSVHLQPLRDGVEFCFSHCRVFCIPQNCLNEYFMEGAVLSVKNRNVK